MGLATHVLMRPPAPPSLITHDEVIDYVANEFDRALYRTLVVGGEASVLRKLTPRLRRHLLKVDGHWPWKKQAGAFPDTIEVLFVLTDMVSHSLSGLAIEEARKRGIPIIMGGRKHALNVDKLAAAGFPEVPMLAPKPAVSPKRQKADIVSTAPKPVPIAPVPTAPVPVLMAATPVETTAPEPNLEEPTMPSHKATPLKYTQPADTGEEQRIARRLLAAEPHLSNHDIIVKAGQGWTLGKVANIAKLARKALGIEVPRNAKPEMTIHRATYLAECARLGVTPLEVPLDGQMTRTVRGRGRPVVPASEEAPVNAAARLDAKAASLSMKARSVEVATVPTSSVPPALLAAYHGAQQGAQEASTTIEALRLLLEAMRAEGVASVTVSDDGSVNMQRRVVVSSSMTL